MVIDGWTIGKDSDGYFAHEPRGPSWVRVYADRVEMNTHDGGCTVPSKVMSTLESLVGCNCNPLENTGGGHSADCPCYQPEWEGPGY